MPRARRPILVLFAVASLWLAASACNFGESFGTDSRCDRRYGTNPKPDPFCQELLHSVAGKKFREDCQTKLRGLPGEGTCPRARIIAGCKSLESHDDGSETIDWFYDVSGEDIDIPKERYIQGEADVRKLCDDRTRYADGAVFMKP